MDHVRSPSAEHSDKVFMVGLSGASSAGKTTLAHLLNHVFFNRVFILHSDDFCKEFEDIPTVNGYIDCDGPAGVDFVRMVEVLNYIKDAAKAPPDFKSWQADVFPGQEEAALKLVPPQLLTELQEKVRSSGRGFEQARMVIVEGFMLYNVKEVRQILDAKLFIRLSHQTAKHRRMNRQNYGADAKPDEFWKTEDYFEKMVWRNYKAEHATFFEGGDVEGVPDGEKCSAAGIDVQTELDVDLETTLRWATDVLLQRYKT